MNVVYYIIVFSLMQTSFKFCASQVSSSFLMRAGFVVVGEHESVLQGSTQQKRVLHLSHTKISERPCCFINPRATHLLLLCLWWYRHGPGKKRPKNRIKKPFMKMTDFVTLLESSKDLPPSCAFITAFFHDPGVQICTDECWVGSLKCGTLRQATWMDLAYLQLIRDV